MGASLCNLAEKAVTAAKSVNCYVLIDAGEANRTAQRIKVKSIRLRTAAFLD